MCRQYQWIQAVILLFVIFFVYVFKINHTAGIDEILTFFKYTQTSTNILLYDAPNNHIIHSFFVWISTSLLGDSLLAIRLPAFMAGILSLSLLYRLGTRWQNHYVGIIAMILMSIVSSFSSYSVDGRGYTLSILFTLMLVDVVASSDFNVTVQKGLKILFLSLCVILVVPSNAYLVASIILWQLIVTWRLGKRTQFKNSIYGILAIAIGGVVYLALLLITSPSGVNEEFEAGYTNINSFIFQTTLRLFDNPSLNILLLFIFLWGAWTAFQKHKQKKFLLIAVIILGPIFFSSIQWIVTHRLFYPRNYLYLLPLTSIIGALGIYRLSKFRMNLIISLLLLTVGLLGIRTIESNPHIRAWLTSIETNALDNDMLFIGTGIFDPIYYHIRVQDDTEIDYFMPSEQTNRFVFIPTSMDVDELININELQSYIGECEVEVWNSRNVTTCPIINKYDTQDYSRCFVTIYPHWRECWDVDRILSSE